MDPDTARTYALQSVLYITSEDDIRNRFLSLTGMTADSIRTALQNDDFLCSLLEFLVNFEPDLINCAARLDIEPDILVQAWRTLGGGAGQEW